MLKKIRTREFWFQVLKQLICITMVIIVVLPILLTLFASLKNKGDMVTTSPLALPSFDRITLENYPRCSRINTCSSVSRTRSLFWSSAFSLT